MAQPSIHVSGCAVIRSLLAGLGVALVLVPLSPDHGTAQTRGISGRAVDAEDRRSLSGVTVLLTSGTGAVMASERTDEDGAFLLSELSTGRYSLVLEHPGYTTARVDQVEVGSGVTSIGAVELTTRVYLLNPIVVTASREYEKVLEAPASVHTVPTARIEAQPATTVVDHLFGLPGVDIISTGIARHSMAARGFNSTFGTSLFVLTDYRWSSLPSLRFNAFNLLSSTNEDVERVELVLGPGSALYGPNTANGVLHIITRSPLEHTGSSLSLTGGERDLYQGSVRHAGRFTDDVGYKISGLYHRANEWPFTDSVETANRQLAIQAGADPDTLRIGRRKFDSERLTLDARVDFRLSDVSTVVLSGGTARLVSSLEQATTQTAQADDWTHNYVQTRFRRDRLFAQTYLNWSDAGETYLLRTGAPIVDNSLLYSAQLQHGMPVGSVADLTYGLDLFRTVPRTEGTLHGSNEENDAITELGGYLQSELRLSPELEVVGAMRLDRHSAVDEVVVSPRAAVVFEPREGHSLRLTYNRAFNQPTATNLFIDVLSSPTLGGLPFSIRAAGVPADGFGFARDCALPGAGTGLCMRSPFTPAELGGPSRLLPADATMFWDAVVRIVETQDAGAGALLRQMSAPDAGLVGSAMATLNPATGRFDRVGVVNDIRPLGPSITNTLELGFKGLFRDRLLLALDVHYNRVDDFVSPLLVGTPNVFLDAESVAEYLASEAGRLGLGLDDDQLAGLGAALARIPVGTVTPREHPAPDDPAGIVLTYRNFGDISYWGSDFSATLIASDRMTLSTSYSFLSENFFEGVDGVSDVPLNAPRHKAAVSGRYTEDRLGFGAEIRVRHVGAFHMSSGVFVGDIPSYTLVDASATYSLPFVPHVELALDGRNLFDDRHQESPGAPFLGRLVMARVRWSIQ